MIMLNNVQINVEFFNQGIPLREVPESNMIGEIAFLGLVICCTVTLVPNSIS
jgi:hypothetical protein